MGCKSDARAHMQHIGYIKLAYTWSALASATQTIHVYWCESQQSWLEKGSYDAWCHSPYHAPLLNEFVAKAGLKLGIDCRGFSISEDRAVASPQGIATGALYACGLCELTVCMRHATFKYRCDTTDSLRKFLQQDVSDLVMKSTLHTARVWKAALWKHAFSRRFVIDGALDRENALRVCSQIARNFDTFAEYLCFMRQNLRYMHASVAGRVIECGRAYFVIRRRVIERNSFV